MSRAASARTVYRGLPLWVKSEDDARTLLAGGPAAVPTLLRLLTEHDDGGLGVWWTSEAGEVYSHAEATSGDYALSLRGSIEGVDSGTDRFAGCEVPVVLTANAPTVWEQDDWEVDEGSQIDLVSIRYSAFSSDDNAWIEVPVGRTLTASDAQALFASLGSREAGMLDLYHRTTPEAAAAILEQSRMISRENTQEVYFSTVSDGQAEGYGTAVVHVRVPEHLAEIDDEFPSGEQHYRVRASDLRPEHFVRSASLHEGAIAPERQGQCYPLAYEHLMTNDDGQNVLVHGTINGGATNHAWVEWVDTVYDPVLDEEFTRDFYYTNARADADRTYTADEAEEEFETNGHYGPWDGSVHTAMAATTGIPEIDALIEDFKREPLSAQDWGPGGGPVSQMSDPYNAHGYCQMLSEQFVEFAKRRGFRASTNDLYLDEIGYTPTGGPYGEVLDADGEIVQGYYPEHTVAVITVDDGSAYGRDIYIDFTAAQYGYTDFPKVTGSLEHTASGRTAALPADLVWSVVVMPEGLRHEMGGTVYVDKPGFDGSELEWPYRKEAVGLLRWFGSGEVMDTWVHPDYRRQGLATEMWRRAKEADPSVYKSQTMTPVGEQFWGTVSQRRAEATPEAWARTVVASQPAHLLEQEWDVIMEQPRERVRDLQDLARTVLRDKGYGWAADEVVVSGDASLVAGGQTGVNPLKREHLVPEILLSFMAMNRVGLLHEVAHVLAVGYPWLPGSDPTGGHDARWRAIYSSLLQEYGPASAEPLRAALGSRGASMERTALSRGMTDAEEVEQEQHERSRNRLWAAGVDGRDLGERDGIHYEFLGWTPISGRAGRVVATQGLSDVGGLEWKDGVIASVWVARGYRRQGIASQMLEFAREVDPRGVQHSRLLTEEGRAWSQTVGSLGSVPPEPGASPIPPGTTRLYHVTPERNLDAIRQQGLLVDRSVANMGAGSATWASKELDYWRGDPGVVMVEFYATQEQMDSRLEWSATAAHVGLTVDIPSSQFVAVHEPWHRMYHHILRSPATLAQTLAGENDGASDPDVRRAVDEIKRTGARVATFDYDHARKTYDQVRSIAKQMSLSEATTLVRRVLTDAGFPEGDQAMAVPHPSGYGTSSVGWDMELADAGIFIPLVALAENMRDEFTVLHEAAHIIRNGPEMAGRRDISGTDLWVSSGGHDQRWWDTFTRLIGMYATPLLANAFRHLVLKDVEPGLLRAASADLMLHEDVYYRVHHLQRAFSVDDAWSAPLTVSFDDDLDEPREGYSACRTPWDLWGYVVLQSWVDRTSRDEILIFSGDEIGEGIDGEPLVIPDFRVQRWLSWRDFLWALSRMTGRMPDSITGPLGSMPMFLVAKQALDQDRNDPVAQRIMVEMFPPGTREVAAPGYGMLPIAASLGSKVASRASLLPDVGPTADTYWGQGGCGAMALAFVTMFPELKIAVEWGTGHDEGYVWHTVAYDPVTKRSFDFQGTGHVDIEMGLHGGDVEMDVAPQRVADAMDVLRGWTAAEPWANDLVFEASGVIEDHWGLDEGFWAQGSKAVGSLAHLVTGSLTMRTYHGKPGRRDHITGDATGTLPIEYVRNMPGKMGEVPGAHRNKQGQEWEAFKADVATRGIIDPIFIVVEENGTDAFIYEGNHRRDAAVEIGMSEVPVHIRFFGKSEDVHPLGALPERLPPSASLGSKVGAYFHTSPYDLSGQEYILPPSQTGVRPNWEGMDETELDQVFMSLSEGDAWGWAEELYDPETETAYVYEVEPEGVEEHGFIAVAPRAKIIRRVTASDYRMTHQPDPDGPPLHDLLAGDMAPRDVYEHPEYYTGFARDAAGREAIEVIDRVRGNPDAMVTIYRSLPPNVPQEINPGDWVTLSRSYARMHGMGRGWEEWIEPAVPNVFEEGEGWVAHDDDWPVVSRQVPAWQVRWDVNDLVEMGWFPNGQRVASLTRQSAVLSSEQVAHLNDVRDYCVSRGETNFRGGPSCGYATEIISVEDPTFTQVWGAIALPDGRRPEHVWLVLADGTIVDPTADQFGYEPIRVLRPGQPGYDTYLPGVDGDDRDHTASSLSLEDYISVAENAIERGYPKAGELWHLADKSNFPKAYENPDYWEAMGPVKDFVLSVLSRAGKSVHKDFRVIGDGWHVTQNNVQGATDGANWIDLRSPATLLTILHECAHVIRGTGEGVGHDAAFVDTLAGLLDAWVSTAAAEQFRHLVGFHDEMKAVGSRAEVTYRVVYRDALLSEGEAMVVATVDGWDVGALRWDYYSDPPVVVDVSVEEEYRRQGIATEMLRLAREKESRLVHSDVLTDDGRGWMQAVGSWQSPTSGWKRSPGGNNYRTSIVGKNGLTYYITGGPEKIKAFTEKPWGSEISKEGVGTLVSWDWNGRREIYQVGVNKEHRRQGVASAMLALAREFYPDLVHAGPGSLSDDGAAWAGAYASLRTESAEREIVVSAEGHLWTWRCSVCGEGPPNRGYRDKDTAREMGHTHAQWCWDLGWDDEPMIREAALPPEMPHEAIGPWDVPLPIPGIVIDVEATDNYVMVDATDGGTWVGSLEAQIEENCVFIANVQVAETHQRKGLATAMLREVVERYPGRLYDGVAVSDQGEGFLGSLGLPRYLDPRDVSDRPVPGRWASHTAKVFVPDDPSRYGDTSIRYELGGNGPVLDPATLPSQVYHVTTAGSRIGGVLHADHGMGGGLGGNSGEDRSVSFTISREVADDIASAMSLMATAAREFQQIGKGEAYYDYLVDLAAAEGWVFDGDGRGWLSSFGSWDFGDWMRFWFQRRSTVARKRDPLFFGVKVENWVRVNPDDVGYVTASREDIIASGAMVTDFDLGSGRYGLQEIRVWGDVKVGGFTRAGSLSRVAFDYDRTAMADDQGYWYHYGTSMARFEVGQYVHVGTREAAEARHRGLHGEGNFRHDGTLMRVRIAPRNPLGSVSSPLDDHDVNILTWWEGYAVQTPGEMPSEDNGGDDIPWQYKGVTRRTPRQIAADTGYQGAWTHDAFFYRNNVEDRGSVSVAIDPDCITEQGQAPPTNPDVGPGQLLLWGRRATTELDNALAEA